MQTCSYISCLVFSGSLHNRDPCTSTLLWTRLGGAQSFLEEMGKRKLSCFNSGSFLYIIPAVLSMVFWFSLLLKVVDLGDPGCVKSVFRGSCLGTLTHIMALWCPSTQLWCRRAVSRHISHRKVQVNRTVGCCCTAVLRVAFLAEWENLISFKCLLRRVQT